MPYRWAMSQPDGTEAPEAEPAVWVVVVAAGSGARFGGAKQYAPLAGRRVVDWSIDVARSVADGVVLVVPEDEADTEEPAVDAVVPGGATRSASVRAGLAAVPEEAEVVLIHDGARPLASHAMFRSVVDAVLAGADAAVPVVAVIDTITDLHGEPVDRDAPERCRRPRGSGPRRCGPCTRDDPKRPTTPRWCWPEVAGCDPCRANAGTSRSPNPTTSPSPPPCWSSADAGAWARASMCTPSSTTWTDRWCSAG